MKFSNTVFTLGYGGRSKEQFLDLINEHAIKTIVDVRLRPDRASMGIWIRAKTPEKGIEKWLSDAGIGYTSVIELGNLFVELTDWKVRYQRLMAESGELLVERLFQLPEPICLICAEKDIVDCHRKAVADFLSVRFHAKIQHIL